MSKRIILSYDYELFFGDKSGTVQRTLIMPTNLLLDAMDKVGFKGNFFVDYLMLKYLSLEKDDFCRQDYMAVVSQLKDMVRRGHRIELHIHPHWVDAKYNGDGTWIFSEFRHYGLDSFSVEDVTNMVLEGTAIIEKIAREVEPSYKVVAFRAGGWAVQPFKMLKEGFIRAGILIDSSVAHGVQIEKDNTIVDFEKAPNKELYHFSDDVCIEDIGGPFIEIPISIYYRDFFTSLLSFISNKLNRNYSKIPDGTHVRASDKTSIHSNAIKRQSMPAMFSLDNNILRTRIKMKTFKGTLMCFIDHPKDLNMYTLKNIKMLSRYGESATYASLLTNIVQ